MTVMLPPLLLLLLLLLLPLPLAAVASSPLSPEPTGSVGGAADAATLAAPDGAFDAPAAFSMTRAEVELAAAGAVAGAAGCAAAAASLAAEIAAAAAAASCMRGVGPASGGARDATAS
jgi:hypothetical protein